MAQFFTTAPVPFRGSILPKPISLCKPLDRNEQPSALVIEIPWHQTPYNQGAVRVNLTVQGPANPITKIRSVAIDNSAVRTPVYIQFVDTYDVVSCNAHDNLRQAVFTDQLEFIVYAGSLAIGDIQTTRIVISNVYIDPINTSDFPFAIGGALANTTVGNPQPRFLPDALGDVTATINFQLNTVHSDQIFPAVAVGFYIIKDIYVGVRGAFHDGGQNVNVNLTFSDFAVSNIIFNTAFTARPTPAYSNFAGNQLYVMHNATQYLVATTSYILTNSVAIPRGVVNMMVKYTYTPSSQP